MPNCKVTTGSGEHCEVEADGFQLLAETGFVLLKRRPPEAPAGQVQVPAEQTVAIFYRPDKVVLELPENKAGAEGTFTG